MTFAEFGAVMDGVRRFLGGADPDESASLRSSFLEALADELEAGGA